MGLPDRDRPGARAVLAFLYAAAAAGFALWIGSEVPPPWVLDPSHPDFTLPAVLAIGAAGLALWFAGSGVLWALRARRFGAAELVLDTPRPPRLGQTVAGRIRFARPFRTAGSFRIRLVCKDIHEFADENPRHLHRRVPFPVWSAEVAVPPGADARQGLPFRFELPASVGPAPVPSGILADGARHRSRFSVHIPGLRRVAARNLPPVDRRWTLEVRAPSALFPLRAELALEVQGSPCGPRSPRACLDSAPPRCA